MFDLRNNAFFILGVTPSSTSPEIADAFERVVSKQQTKEQELQTAVNNIMLPSKRYLEELTYLWGISPDNWNDWLSSLPNTWDDLTTTAKRNLAAHFCYFAPKKARKQLIEKALKEMIQERDSYVELFEEIKTSREMAQFPPPQETYYNEALEVIAALHQNAAIYALEQEKHGGEMMAKIVKKWRFDYSRTGLFVMDMSCDYRRRATNKICSLEENIFKNIRILKNDARFLEMLLGGKRPKNEVENKEELDQLEKLLSKWEKCIKPIQLMNEAKGLNDPRSKEIYINLNELAMDYHAIFHMSKQGYRVSRVLLKTFSDLPWLEGPPFPDAKIPKIIADNRLVRMSLGTRTEAIVPKAKANNKLNRSNAVRKWLKQVHHIKENPSDFIEDINHKMKLGRWPERTKSFISISEEVLKLHAQELHIWFVMMIIYVEIFERACKFNDVNSHRAAFSFNKMVKKYAFEYNAPTPIKKELRRSVWVTAPFMPVMYLLGFLVKYEDYFSLKRRKNTR